MNDKPLRSRFSDLVERLQNDICSEIEDWDEGGTFRTDEWAREEGGGGVTRIRTGGDLIEKGGVNRSTVYGRLPEPVRQQFEVEEGVFQASGLSIVLHPESPMIPTVHANIRYFELYRDEVGGTRRDAWFGGGIDLTPYYLWEEDVISFHRTLKEVCDRYGSDLYSRFKQQCDDYFYLDHRKEARGVGGIFYDYVRPDDDRSSADWFQFSRDVGEAFLPCYRPIVRRRRDEPWQEKHRRFQERRRGRYVEFNLVYDRGTRFGLKTEGRTESVLMSMPPRVRWEYDVDPDPGSREEELLQVLKSPRDWLDAKS